MLVDQLKARYLELGEIWHGLTPSTRLSRCLDGASVDVCFKAFSDAAPIMRALAAAEYEQSTAAHTAHGRIWLESASRRIHLLEEPLRRMSRLEDSRMGWDVDQELEADDREISSFRRAWLESVGEADLAQRQATHGRREVRLPTVIPTSADDGWGDGPVSTMASSSTSSRPPALSSSSHDNSGVGTSPAPVRDRFWPPSMGVNDPRNWR